MAYYQKVDIPSSGSVSNQFLIDLAAFAAENGWSIDFNGVYLTSWRRLHMHKGGLHVDMASNAALSGTIYGCTGYAAGNTPATQPGVDGPSRTFVLVYNGRYMFVSTVGGLYMGLQAVNNGSWGWGGFYLIQSKLGSFTEGFGVVGLPSSSNGFGSSFAAPATCHKLFYNGAWSTIVAAGGIITTADTTLLANSRVQPFFYNAGILPIPILILVGYIPDSSKYQPLGWLPGAYLTSGGDVYNTLDLLTIGADTYLLQPQYTHLPGSQSYPDWLFKLGA